MKRHYLIYFLLIAIIVLLFRCGNDKINHYKNLNKAIQDSLVTYKDSKGRNVSTISVIELKNQRKLVDSLKKELKGFNKVKSISVIDAKTEIRTITNTVLTHDTIIRDSVIYLSPVYFTKIDTKWTKGTVKATKDSIETNLANYNSYKFILEDKRGVFAKRPSRVSVINENPNTINTGVSSYEFKPKQKIVSLGIQTGLGITPKGIQPYAGVGFQINLR